MNHKHLPLHRSHRMNHRGRFTNHKMIHTGNDVHSNCDTFMSFGRKQIRDHQFQEKHQTHLLATKHRDEIEYSARSCSSCNAILLSFHSPCLLLFGNNNLLVSSTFGSSLSLSLTLTLTPSFLRLTLPPRFVPE